MTAGGALTVYHADGLGSVRAITDASGDVAQTDRTDAWGAPVASAGGSTQPYHFTGEPRDDEAGLVFLRARYDDPALGRFLQRDPVRGRLFVPQSLNGYSYALNNPILHADPSGRIIPALALIAAAAMTPEVAAATVVATGAAYVFLSAHEEDIADWANARLAAVSTWMSTRTDRYKEHLTDDDLDAARREEGGEVVKRKPDGTPFDHVGEVRNAQSGLLRRIKQIKNRLGYPGVTESERQGLLDELGDASRLLDHSEGYLPR